MSKHSTPANETVNQELTHLLEVFNQIDYMDAVWQCDCHCGLVITNQAAQTTLWLKYDEEFNLYKLYCSIPEESFRGESYKFRSLLQIANYISFSNQAYPEFAIHLQIMSDDIEV